MKEQSDIKSKVGEQHGKFHSFKKKRGGRNKGRKQQSADDFFRGVRFSIGRDGPELYLKSVEILVLYVSTQFEKDRNA